MFLLDFMSEGNPPHRKAVKHVAEFAIVCHAGFMQAIQRVRSIKFVQGHMGIHVGRTPGYYPGSDNKSGSLRHRPEGTF